MRTRSLNPTAWILVSALVACGAPAPDAIATGAPEDVGLTSEALAGIAPAMQEIIDEGRAAGIVTLVARHGTLVHWDAHGWRVLGEDPMERDDIFRIYSMTKPVTSVAVMMLVEQGELTLDTELGAVLPEFADAVVYDAAGNRPPARQPTIQDLLMHTSGLTYGDFGNSPVDSMYRAERLGVWATHGNLEETIHAVASIPLLFDPGTRWNYSMSTDVLGRVVEVVSGQTLDVFFRERIFEPLGMSETAFSVPAEKLDRFTGVYGPGEDGLQMIDSPIDGQHTRPAQWLSGGGGLTSTVMDYLRFCQMLLNEGELGGVRLLQPETVRLMRTNHLPEDLVPIGIGGPNQGFGLGFAVDMGEHEGVFKWLGVAGTHFFIDPSQDLIAFAWTQLQPQGRAGLDRVMADLVYGALLAPAS